MGDICNECVLVLVHDASTGLGKAYFASEWSRFYFVLEADEFFYYRQGGMFFVKMYLEWHP